MARGLRGESASEHWYRTLRGVSGTEAHKTAMASSISESSAYAGSAGLPPPLDEAVERLLFLRLPSRADDVESADDDAADVEAGDDDDRPPAPSTGVDRDETDGESGWLGVEGADENSPVDCESTACSESSMVRSLSASSRPD